MSIISRNFFDKINKITLLVTLFLIFVGGFVRSSGSGMGCPDWPKCFGKIIPPTSVAQLPPNYQQQFIDNRLKKNERFAQFLDKIGQSHLATAIRNDVSVLEQEPFNAVKTWIEYVNRLVGASLGFLFILTFIASFSYGKKYKRIVVLSFINIIVVAYQGWLGAMVVSTNLTQWLVTVHMLLALVLLSILLYNQFKVNAIINPKILVVSSTFWLKLSTILAILITIFQIIIGTEVREAIDVIAKSLAYGQRATWVGQIGVMFDNHRDLALIILIFNLGIVFLIRKQFISVKLFKKLAYIIFSLILMQIVFGIILSYFALPLWAQPIHLLISFLMYSTQFYLVLNLFHSKEIGSNLKSTF